MPRSMIQGRGNEPVRILPPEQREAVATLTADGRWLAKTAVSKIVAGYDFPVVWVAWPDEADDLDALTPWPCEDVVPLEEHPDAITPVTALGREGEDRPK